MPQDEILQTSAGMVSHAGAGTLLGALAWGLPSVLLPQHSDQHDNAELAVLAGAALALDPDATTREVVSAAGVAHPLRSWRDTRPRAHSG